ncbi:HAD family hydrolase [Alicyclobacillus ferrooxydans]|uniref:Haloacid dehalogenase n=1 Tax=Alicyclobacillus ferrooxydans TaxID=471514 RepID=A0A0N8PPN0_9BACL|nr:HAD family hydrolase [Alicyclobacillus ferrooxydans]KPV44781.1 hypothetical protein AN477_05735 [Alicyclobacillus ferrooxydans]
MYNLILFDIDGVLLSEERYFDASALTVYELISAGEYMGLTIAGAPVDEEGLKSALLSDESITLIRQFVFANDEVLDFMKRRGINANWDMVYLQFAWQLIHCLNRLGIRLNDVLQGTGGLSEELQSSHLKRIGKAIQEHGLGVLEWADFNEHYEGCTDKSSLFNAVRSDFITMAGVPEEHVEVFCSSLWQLGQEAFQDWYLGEPYRDTGTAQGKLGFLNAEVPLVNPDDFSGVLKQLKAEGIELGIATGRPQTETYVPLRLLGWLEHYHPNRISTASDVLRAQTARGDGQTLSKPHPFSYLRSYLGSPDDETVLAHPLPLSREEGERVLVVGDSVADWMAAHAIGCDFAAVLTGLSGADARAQFESLGCTFIWDSVIDVRTVIE